eukprot:11185584-Lingulodinium_polyedra.AAC.1
MSLVQRRKEHDDSILGPHDGGRFVVATEAPPYPPGTIKQSALNAAVEMPANISRCARSNNCE